MLPGVKCDFKKYQLSSIRPTFSNILYKSDGFFHHSTYNQSRKQNRQKDRRTPIDQKPNKTVCVSQDEVCVYFYNKLVDLHIPGAALRAANPGLVKEPLNSSISNLHTQRTYTHSQVKYLDAHINGLVARANMCIPGGRTHPIGLNCAWYPVYVCVCYSCHKNLFFLASFAVIPFLALNISFIETL